MTQAKPDALLRWTMLLIKLTIGVIVFAGIAIAVGIPVMWGFSDHVIAAVVKESGKPLHAEALPAVTMILFGAMILLGLMFQFLRKLHALVGSLENGSPFVPVNAERLRSMAWLVLAMEGLALLAVPLAVWFHRVLPEGKFHFEVSLGGILTALLLFILARVFDHGTRLTEDVEGTV